MDGHGSLEEAKSIPSDCCDCKTNDMQSINTEAQAFMQRPDQEDKGWVMYPPQAAIGRAGRPGLCKNRDTPYRTNLYGNFQVTIPWTGAYENYKWFGNRGREEKFVEYWVDGYERKVNWFYVTGSFDVCPHKRSTGKIYDLRDLGDEWKGDENGKKTREAFLKFLDEAPAERKPEVRAWQDNWEAWEVERRSDPDISMECAMGNTRQLVEWSYYLWPRPKVEWHPDFPLILGRILDDSEMKEAKPFMGRTFFYTLDDQCEADYQKRKAKKDPKDQEKAIEAVRKRITGGDGRATSAGPSASHAEGFSARKRIAGDDARATNTGPSASHAEDASAQIAVPPAPKQPKMSAQKNPTLLQKTAGMSNRKPTVGLKRNEQRIAMGKRPRGRPRKDSKAGRSPEKEKSLQGTKPAETQDPPAVQGERTQAIGHAEEEGERR